MRHLLALCALIGVSAAAPASALSFAFSFDNNAYGGGPIGVVIRGLADDATGPASSVSVTLNDGGGYGIGEYLSVSSAATNTFTVSAETILGFSFEVLGGNNTLPAVYCCSLMFNNDNNTFSAGLSNSPSGVQGATFDDFVFIPIDDVEAPTPVPAPAALPMLAAAAGALVFVARSRRPGR